MLPLKHISIHGFKSIQDLTDFPLAPGLNVLIGPNGSGKSNFIGFFRLLREMLAGRLQYWTAKSGGADRIVSFGAKMTPTLSASLTGTPWQYHFTLAADENGQFLFTHEGAGQGGTAPAFAYSASHRREPHFPDFIASLPSADKQSLTFRLYHVHDTTSLAAVKRPSAVQDNHYLREEADNLAAYLLRIKTAFPDTYQEIRQTIQLAVPFFDDFVLIPDQLASGDEQVRLYWCQQDSDYIFSPNQLSDGSLRFICLTTALMQPDPMHLLLIDEPELGLHPHAIVILGALLRQAAQRMQIIVSTQSVALVDEMEIEDLIIVERQRDGTRFVRPNPQEFDVWRSDYSTGELWQTNILGGRFP